MKEKILFWLDVGSFNFGIAKFLQEKYDYELFAIYDLNYNQKQSFMHQNIINFKKVWFFRDHISNTKKPDLVYLKSFENRYKINLWMIAYNDELFHKYNLYYKFSYDEILSILEQECRFFESILDEIKPDFLVMRLADLHRTQLLEEMCKSKGVKPLLLQATKISGRSFISMRYDAIDYIVLKNNFQNYNARTITELQEYIKHFGVFKDTKKLQSGGMNLSIWKKVKPTLSFLIKINNKEFRKFYGYYGRTRLRMIMKIITLLLKSRYRKYFIDRNFIREIKGDEKFLYFSMHVEPEAAVSITVPFYTNQIEMITNIARSLPLEYKLYVKEHPVMRYRSWRSISYYKEILDLPNVKLIHPSVTPEEIMSKCSLVVTITGTAGLEAAFYNKPTIIFSDVSYSNLSSVFRIKNIEELPHLIRAALQTKVDPTELNEYLDLVDKSSFEFDIIGFDGQILDRFHYKGFSALNDIPINELSSFLEENRTIFERLAFEHVKKINQHKEHESRNKKII